MGSPRAKASIKKICEKETIMCFTCFKENEASFCLVNLYGSLYKGKVRDLLEFLLFYRTLSLAILISLISFLNI